MHQINEQSRLLSPILNRKKEPSMIAESLYIPEVSPIKGGDRYSDLEMAQFIHSSRESPLASVRDCRIESAMKAIHSPEP